MQTETNTRPSARELTETLRQTPTRADLARLEIEARRVAVSGPQAVAFVRRAEQTLRLAGYLQALLAGDVELDRLSRSGEPLFVLWGSRGAA